LGITPNHTLFNSYYGILAYDAVFVKHQNA